MVGVNWGKQGKMSGLRCPKRVKLSDLFQPI